MAERHSDERLVFPSSEWTQVFWNTARTYPLHALFIRTLDRLTLDLCLDRCSLLQIQMDTADSFFNRNDVQRSVFILNTTVNPAGNPLRYILLPQSPCRSRTLTGLPDELMR